MITPISTTAALTALSFALSLSLHTASFAPSDFIRSSCNFTLFPHLCEKCLLSYTPPLHRHSPRQLAHAALNISADRSSSASAFIHRMSQKSKLSSPPNTRAAAAVRDCVETIDDCADRLRQSVKEMAHMGRYGSASFSWHLSNVQTWVSAALTDQTTCLDSLSQDKSAAAVKPLIRRRIVHISRLTSNSLALINRLQPNN